MKILMAVSGLYFIFFVLFHMYGNLKMLVGQAQFDEYAHHLRTMFEPILPYEGFLWLFRLSLIVAIVAHIYSAVTLWSRANGARSQKYVVKKAVGSSISSRWMRWGGVTLFAFIAFHLLHFTIVKINFNGMFSHEDMVVDGVESPFRLAAAAFKLWWIVAIYLIALGSLAMHLHHGTWSAIQTLGWTNSARSRATAKAAGVIIAAVVAIGFAIPPLAILFGAISVK